MQSPITMVTKLLNTLRQQRAGLPGGGKGRKILTHSGKLRQVGHSRLFHPKGQNLFCLFWARSLESTLQTQSQKVITRPPTLCPDKRQG